MQRRSEQKSKPRWSKNRAAVDSATDPNPADGGWADTNALVGSDGCGEDVNFTTTRTLQQVTIEARSPDGAIVRQLEVVKSNVGDRIEVTP